MPVTQSASGAPWRGEGGGGTAPGARKSGTGSCRPAGRRASTTNSLCVATGASPASVSSAMAAMVVVALRVCGEGGGAGRHKRGGPNRPAEANKSERRKKHTLSSLSRLPPLERRVLPSLGTSSPPLSVNAHHPPGRGRWPARRPRARRAPDRSRGQKQRQAERVEGRARRRPASMQTRAGTVVVWTWNGEGRPGATGGEPGERPGCLRRRFSFRRPIVRSHLRAQAGALPRTPAHDAPGDVRRAPVCLERRGGEGMKEERSAPPDP